MTLSPDPGSRRKPLALLLLALLTGCGETTQYCTASFSERGELTFSDAGLKHHCRVELRSDTVFLIRIPFRDSIRSQP